MGVDVSIGTVDISEARFEAIVEEALDALSEQLLANLDVEDVGTPRQGGV